MSATISTVAERAGLTTDTVRYYERVGLLSQPPRTDAGYRLFDESVVDRLHLIKGAQSIGLRLADIRELLEINDRGACPCGHTEALLRDRVATVQAELRRLSDLRAELVRLLDKHPEQACPDGKGTWWCESEFLKGGESVDVPRLRMPVR